MSRENILIKTSWISTIGNAILSASKIIIGLWAGSLAVVGDGIDSATDVKTKDRIDKEIPRHLPTVIPRRFSLEPKPSRKRTNCKQKPIKSFS